LIGCLKKKESFLDKILKPRMRVLDIGCGAGDLYFSLKQRFKDIEYTGIDSSDNLIDIGKNIDLGVIIGGPPCQGFSTAGWR